ncbi:MarR family winged helix-turn-helix transcriptional regulator [Streptomyces sannanensis]|uniref:MarR family winged helix-turn-helix transcriptional regulator n=1 Tax=Streptomyces sannanensis TaxID=285536 RepID=A0ABP6SJY2_9ACTN
MDNPHTTRDEAIGIIQRELTAFSRRARSKSAEMHPELSLVAFSILDLLAQRGGCRGSELATHFRLDKSTVSRQVADLERRGLLVRETAADDHRGQTLRPSAAGLRAVSDAAERRRKAFAVRFTDWGDDELDQFARCLERYNAVP